MLNEITTASLKKTASLISASLLLFSVSMTVSAETVAPATYSGDAVAKVDDNHYRVRITSLIAAKMRCVAYNNENPIAINSVAIYPPEGASDFYIDPKEGPVTHAKCWVTSTREEDRKKLNQLEKEAQKRDMKVKESDVPFYQVKPKSE